jgi:hypothetical protein
MIMFLILANRLNTLINRWIELDQSLMVAICLRTFVYLNYLILFQMSTRLMTRNLDLCMIFAIPTISQGTKWGQLDKNYWIPASTAQTKEIKVFINNKSTSNTLSYLLNIKDFRSLKNMRRPSKSTGIIPRKVSCPKLKGRKTFCQS